MFGSEFTDEYGDWLAGTRPPQVPSWLSSTLGEMRHAPVLRVEPTTPVRTVVETMNRHRESAVLVMEGPKIVGIFTERDVLVRVLPRMDGLLAEVAEMMTERPNTLSSLTPLSVALRELALGGYHHLPVVDEAGRPLALVSLVTIVAHLVETFPGTILNAPPERESFPPEGYGA